MCENIIRELEYKGKCNTFSYMHFVNACISNGNLEKAIKIVSDMKDRNIEPNFGIFIPLLKELTRVQNKKLGLELYKIIKLCSGLESEQLSNCIISFALKVKEPLIAIKECEKLMIKGLMDVVSWNCLIQAYIQLNDLKKAISLIDEMKKTGISPNTTTLTILISGCTCLNSYEEGIIHEISKITINNPSPKLVTSIIYFYIKCGYPELAIEQCLIFKEKRGLMNVVSWNYMIQAYIQLNDINKAICMIDEMKKNGISPNAATFTILISKCASLNLYEEGRMIHEMANNTLKNFSTELLTGVANFYTKCGHPELAIKECEKLMNKGLMDVISWTCLIQAYIESTQNPSNQDYGLNKAIYAYNDMKNQGIEPDIATYLVLLTGCSEYVAKGIGLQLIQDIKIKGMDLNEDIASAMGYFYSRIGYHKISHQIFDTLLKKEANCQLSIVTYNNMLRCLAQHGKGVEAFELFNKLVEKNVKFSEHTFTIMLNAFSHCGMIDKAIQLYKEMSTIFTQEHTIYIDCVMVDVFARAGRFTEAEEVINRRNDIRLWSSLMGGCRKFNNVELGEKVFNVITNIDATVPSVYVLLSNIYTYHGLTEKTAIAHAFVLNPNRDTIVLTTNLRICNDCHSASEFISKVMNVEITVRDANRHHHFKDGKYW